MAHNPASEFEIGSGVLEEIQLECADDQSTTFAAWQLLREVPHYATDALKSGNLIAERPGRNLLAGHRHEPDTLPWSIWIPNQNVVGNWIRESGIEADVAADLFRLDRIERSPQYSRAAELANGWAAERGWLKRRSFVVTSSHAFLTDGDVLVLQTTTHGSNPFNKRSVRGGSARWVSLSELEELRSSWIDGQLEADCFLDLGLPPFGGPRFYHSSGYSSALDEFFRNRRYWGRASRSRPNEWKPALTLIRPFSEAVSAPITAVTETAALFELIAQSGGRLSAVTEIDDG